MNHRITRPDSAFRSPTRFENQDVPLVRFSSESSPSNKQNSVATMIRLSREIRFALVSQNLSASKASANSWAGWPSTNLIVPHLVLRCVVEGEPDPRTGYLCDVQLVDRLLRTIVVEELIKTYDGTQTAEQLLRMVFERTNHEWTLQPNVISVTLALTPFLEYQINFKDPAMVLLTQQFEFSAAHRLHCSDLTEQQNREVFGKCNNPEGHGHNYVFEVSVDRPSNANHDSEQVIELEQFEATVKELIVDRLDHKHLNRDVDYFAKVNPSVENIAVAIYRWLDGQFGDARLNKVRVYETPKTWAEFSG